MRTRIIDLDGSVAGQAPLAALADEGLARVLDMRAEAPALRIIARRAAMLRFGEAVAAASLPGRGAEVTFYGSGDFHHLSAALVQRFDEALSVVHLDNHPDWVRFPATFNCGAWVNRALDLPNVRKIITIGPCSDDLKWPELKSANLAAIAAGRLEVFPWRAAPSRVFAQRDGKDGYIRWRNLADEAFDGFLEDLVAKIPTRAIYLTIDKDALTVDEAITNWDQGQMRLAHVQALVAALAKSFKILGVDVCGDYSLPRFADPFRATLAWLDHPRAQDYSGKTLAINARTNAALLGTFRSVL